jgi:hypothetical protein
VTGRAPIAAAVMRHEPERLRRGRAGRELVRRRFTCQLVTVYDAAAGRSTVAV